MTLGEITVRSFTVRDPVSGRSLSAWLAELGEDVVVAVGGGERPHVGCVVLAQPQPRKGGPARWTASCSVLTIPPHKEEPIARGVAARLAERCGRVAVVSAGVHDDGLDRQGIEDYLRLGEELAEVVAGALGPRNG
jgi:hypothetical protein